jgi:hypothetical protein
MSTGSKKTTSRRSSARRSERPLEFLIDRSLGRLAVPRLLREAGLVVHTLADLYGEEQAQKTDDVEWIALAAERDYVVLCKDDRIRRNQPEREALIAGGVRAFCITNGHLTYEVMAAYFIANKNRIIQRCRKPGPYLIGVYKDHLMPLWPSEIRKDQRA